MTDIAIERAIILRERCNAHLKGETGEAVGIALGALLAGLLVEVCGNERDAMGALEAISNDIAAAITRHFDGKALGDMPVQGRA